MRWGRGVESSESQPKLGSCPPPLRANPGILGAAGGADGVFLAPDLRLDVAEACMLTPRIRLAGWLRGAVLLALLLSMLSVDLGHSTVTFAREIGVVGT